MTQTNSKPTSIPRRKVLSAGFTGALVTLIVIILNTYVLDEEKEISPELSAAATTVLSFIVSYLTPPGENETTTVEDGNTKSALKE